MDDPTLLSWIEKGQNVAALLVAIGVAAEFVLGFMAVPARHRLDQAKDAEMIGLKDKSAGFEKEAASLRKDAEGLKSENLKLQAQISPRRLTVAQQQAIAENCSKFKNLFVGKRIKLVSYSLDTEAFVLAEQVVTALRMKPCEMIVDDDAMSITPGMGTLVMGIQVFGSDSELAKKIAEAIGSSGKPVAVSFTAFDPTVGAVRFETANSRLPHEATVLVGLKPPDTDTVKELNRIMPTTKRANR